MPRKLCCRRNGPSLHPSCLGATSYHGVRWSHLRSVKPEHSNRDGLLRRCLNDHPASGKLRSASVHATSARRKRKRRREQKRSHDVKAIKMKNSNVAMANMIISPPQPIELLAPLTSPKKSKSSSKVLAHWWIEWKADGSLDRLYSNRNSWRDRC